MAGAVVKSRRWARHETKVLQAILLGSFGIIVVYPVFFLLLGSPTVGHLSLVAVSRLALFFCWFQLTGYWFFRYLSRSAASPRTTVTPIASGPPVTVLIPVRDEPVELIRRMVEHIQDIDYSPLTVIIIDNSSTSQRTRLVSIADILELHSVKIVRKRGSKGFKAGALNRAMAILADDVRYVLVLDIDHAPEHHILQTLVPMLEADSALAFVQAPQSYSAFENSLVEGAFCLKQRIFHEHICPGLSAAGCMFMTGSNTLIRVEALRQVGGFDESSLTEDLRTSLNLHCLGWKSLYTPQTVGSGFAPLTLAAYHGQLRRWAIGTFQNWRTSMAILLKEPSTLSVEQWLFYLGWNGLFYFQGIITYLLLSLSLMQSVPGPRSLTPAIDTIVMACLGATALAIMVYQKRQCKANLRTIAASSALFYGALIIMIGALVDLWRKNRLSFDVTPKTKKIPGRPAGWSVAFHIALCIAVGIVWLKAGRLGLAMWTGAFWPMMFSFQSGTMGLIGLAAYFGDRWHAEEQE